MSFNSYCRTCSLHLAGPMAKISHIRRIHGGVPQPNPDISEELFYSMKSNDLCVRAKTCPVCLIYFDYVETCVAHVPNSHPEIITKKSPAVREWEQIVEIAFPGHIWITPPPPERRLRPHRLSSSTSDSDDDDPFEICKRLDEEEQSRAYDDEQAYRNLY